MFFIWCVRQFLLDKFLTLGHEKDSHFPNTGVCRQFVRVFSQVSAKQKRSSPCLWLAAVQSFVRNWKTEEPCQVHRVASWESLSCRRERWWSHLQRKRVVAIEKPYRVGENCIPRLSEQVPRRRGREAVD